MNPAETVARVLREHEVTPFCQCGAINTDPEAHVAAEVVAALGLETEHDDGYGLFVRYVTPWVSRTSLANNPHRQEAP